jgi:hypothetical protein
MSSAPIARLYADLKRLSADLKKEEKQEKSLRYLLATRERLLTQVLPRDAAGNLLPEKKWSRGVRRWWNENERAIREATERSEAARKAIEARQEELQASIEQEAVYRADKMETRRRQRVKGKPERSPKAV